MKYIAGSKINEAKTDSYRNPFIKDIIEVGNNPDDHLQYANFFDLSQIDPNDLSKPLFIHLDMSLSGGNNDKTGIAGVWISGREANTKSVSTPLLANGGTTSAALEQGTLNPEIAMDLHYKLAFSVSVKAPKGSQISFAKNKNFIRWLKDQGFNIQCISTDTFQSSSLREDLKNEGFNTEVVSVDRVTKDASGKPLCLPYYYLKNAIYERRLTMYRKCDLLTDELIGLERKSDGHIDHTKEGINSKDQADAVCLTGDTIVTMADETKYTIKELYDKFTAKQWKPYVLSFDATVGSVIPVQIQEVVDNGYKSNLVKVILSNGKIITCTEDHLLLMSNSQYIEAERAQNKLLQGFKSNNVRVISVERLTSSEEVFDIKLGKIHNFAIDAGIYVHNCGATWAASHFSDEYSYNYGDTIVASLDANDVGNDNYKKQQMIVDFEQELLSINMEFAKVENIRSTQQEEE